MEEQPDCNDCFELSLDMLDAACQPTTPPRLDSGTQPGPADITFAPRCACCMCHGHMRQLLQDALEAVEQHDAQRVGMLLHQAVCQLPAARGLIQPFTPQAWQHTAAETPALATQPQPQPRIIGPPLAEVRRRAVSEDGRLCTSRLTLLDIMDASWGLEEAAVTCATRPTRGTVSQSGVSLSEAPTSLHVRFAAGVAGGSDSDCASRAPSPRHSVSTFLNSCYEPEDDLLSSTVDANPDALLEDGSSAGEDRSSAGEDRSSGSSDGSGFSRWSSYNTRRAPSRRNSTSFRINSLRASRRSSGQLASVGLLPTASSTAAGAPAAPNMRCPTPSRLGPAGARVSGCGLPPRPPSRLSNSGTSRNSSCGLPLALPTSSTSRYVSPQRMPPCGKRAASASSKPMLAKVMLADIRSCSGRGFSVVMGPVGGTLPGSMYGGIEEDEQQGGVQ